MRGFRDANKLGSSGAARRKLDEDFSSLKMDFHQGYIQGLRDAGWQGLTASMHNLAAKRTSDGYSTGYMQGFRDGNSGIFGDRLTTTLLKKLEEQYPNQEDYRGGYVDGFRDGAQSRGGKDGESRIDQSLSRISERLNTLERTAPGDEIHTTKIYHVYNQLPEGAGYSTAGMQLAQELEELSSSRRSTLRRHYTVRKSLFCAV